jgi:GT2 family glycosyltransferase/glycosyltransferase involved in cell wall biosynthesis
MTVDDSDRTINIDRTALSAEVDLGAIAGEIAGFMAWDPESTRAELERELQFPGIHVKEAWQLASPQSPEDIENFYRTTTSYIYTSMVDSSRDVRSRWRAAVLETLARSWGKTSSARVLDYGGGVGEESLYFARHCQQVAYYDLPGLTSEFASRRFLRQRLPIFRLSQTASYGAEFDAVVSFEVRQHLINPILHLDEMVRLTKPGGLLFLLDSFEPTNDVDSSPLRSNCRLAGELESFMRERGCQLLTVREGCISIFVKGPAVSVVIPIYNAAEHVRQLLESIESTNPNYPVRWLLANDASTDSTIEPLLQSFAARFPDCRTVLTHATNGGFIVTCNDALREVGADDVILLNSDTLVYDGWVRRLVEAAYESEDIATVTPLSNNASAFSVLKGVGQSNQINAMLSERKHRAIDIPTGVGFCLYVKRHVLDKIGPFDTVFERGYGEETDLCQRAVRAGYRNVLTPNVFIFHTGNASMVSAGVVAPGESTVQEHETIIGQRYPGYNGKVQAFIASGVVRQLNRDLAMQYVMHESDRRRSVAMVMHTNPFGSAIGGIEYHVLDAIRDLAQEYVCYVLFPASGALRVTAIVDGIRSSIDWLSDDFVGLLRSLNPGLIHVHHLMNHSPAFVDALVGWSGPKVFTIHDYFGLCRRYTLLNEHAEFCGVPAQGECDRCAAVLFESEQNFPARQRRMHQRLVDSADVVVTPSHAALEVFSRAITVAAERVRVIPHPIPPESYGDSQHRLIRADAPLALRERETATQEKHTPFTVGIIGYDSEHKGGALVKGVISACQSKSIRFVAIGNMLQGIRATATMVSTGLYAREEVIDLIKAQGIDAILIASPWPETYSYTLSEAWEAGVPAIVGPLGAPAERVMSSGGGIVVPKYDVTSFASAIRTLADDPSQLALLEERVAHISPSRRFSELQRTYSSLLAPLPTKTDLFAAEGREEMTRQYIPQSTTDLPPLIVKMVKLRKKVFPTGTFRERVYFRVHNVVTRSYTSGGVH